jgi:hypothetical protein
VGDGRSFFHVNSTSGGLRLLAAKPEDRVVTASAPSASAGSVSESPTATSAAAGAAADTAAAQAEAEAEAEGSSRAESVESWNPEEAAESEGDLAAEEELAVLQALERGEIGVDEAAERLDRSGR